MLLGGLPHPHQERVGEDLGGGRTGEEEERDHRESQHRDEWRPARCVQVLLRIREFGNTGDTLGDTQLLEVRDGTMIFVAAVAVGGGDDSGSGSGGGVVVGDGEDGGSGGSDSRLTNGAGMTRPTRRVDKNNPPSRRALAAARSQGLRSPGDDDWRTRRPTTLRRGRFAARREEESLSPAREREEKKIIR